jgi:TP901 family phage tail tape measure protein
MGIEQGVGFPISATDAFSGMFDKLIGRVTSAQSAFQRLSGTLAGISSALTIGGFVAFVKSAADAQEEINKLSQKLGIGVGELSAYKYALNQADVPLEAFGKGVKSLSQKLVEAGDSTSKAGRLMNTLGVDIGKGATPAIEKIADAFAKLPDGTTKATLAVELFGKSGMDMIPFLNQGSAGIRLMKEEAARLGLVMNEETTKAAEEFNDNLKVIHATSQRLGITLMNDLAPALVRITGAMKEAVAEGGILKGIWVAMGGVMAEAFGLNDDPVSKRIRQVNSELAKLHETIANGPKGLGDGIFDRAPIVAASRRSPSCAKS